MPIIDARQDAPSEDVQIQFGEDRYLTIPHDSDVILLEGRGDRIVIAETPREFAALFRAGHIALSTMRERASAASTKANSL